MTQGLDPGELRVRLAAARVARLATVRPDGAPHLVPFCFALEGEVLYSAVDAKPKRRPGAPLARFRNVEAEPRVSVLVDHWSEDWGQLWWVRVDGRAAALAPGSDEERRALGLLTDKYPQYRAAPPAGPVLAITGERWSGWSAAS
jgi:PPOX class probable F420-dependent enzyme